MTFCLGLSAGVMLTISVFDLLLPSLIYASAFWGVAFCMLWFFAGIGAEVALSSFCPRKLEQTNS